MQPGTPDDLFDLIDSYVAAAAVGAALEHGLFWLLADRPFDATEVAAALGIPEHRCGPWLQLIGELGLLDAAGDRYRTSERARRAIVDAYSRSTWAFLAREARERFPAVRDLAVQLTEPGTPWEAQGLDPPDYLSHLRERPDRASAFTAMLYEIHLPLADALADSMAIEGGGRLLDVGGGSGVMSFALLRRSPSLEAVVADLPNVCAAGTQIAADNGLQDRIEYMACDFVADRLPTGFDLTLYCDVGPYSEAMFVKLRSTLAPGGRLVIVGKFGARPGLAHPTRIHWALVGSLSDGVQPRRCTAEVCDMLRAAGFEEPSASELPDLGSRWSSGWTRIIAHG